MEVLDGPENSTAAAAAVADEGNQVGDVVGAVDQTGPFARFEGFQGFLAGEFPRESPFHAEPGDVAEAHAAPFGNVLHPAGAVQELGLVPAETPARGEKIGLCDHLAHSFVGEHLGKRRHLLLHRDHPGEGIGKLVLHAFHEFRGDEGSELGLELFQHGREFFLPRRAFRPHELKLDNPGDDGNRAVFRLPLTVPGEKESFPGHLLEAAGELPRGDSEPAAQVRERSKLGGYPGADVRFLRGEDFHEEEQVVLDEGKLITEPVQAGSEVVIHIRNICHDSSGAQKEMDFFGAGWVFIRATGFLTS